VGERLPSWVRLRCGLEPRTFAALCLVLVVAAGFAAHRLLDARPAAVAVTETAAPTPSPAPTASPAPAGVPGDAATSPPASVVVDVAGRVAEPGVYTLPAGARVADALDAAGGVRPGTDTGGLNRARVLLDGEHVLVGETPPPGQPPPPAAPAAPAAAGGVVSLNAATAAQLQELPGIGPVLADRILAWRDTHGGFTSVDQLGEVAGIGDRRLAELRDHVVP
jgi:competence protein ComEA